LLTFCQIDAWETYGNQTTVSLLVCTYLCVRVPQPTDNKQHTTFCSRTNVSINVSMPDGCNAIEGTGPVGMTLDNLY
jgi:hypothetical protein